MVAFDEFAEVRGAHVLFLVSERVVEVEIVDAELVILPGDCQRGNAGRSGRDGHYFDAPRQCVPHNDLAPGRTRRALPASLHKAQLSPASMRCKMASPFCKACS